MADPLLQDFLSASDLGCDHPPIEISRSIEHAREMWETASTCRQRSHDHQRWLALHDLYILVRYVLGADFMEHPWLFDRAKEIEPEGARENHIDTWFRGAGKSTLETLGLNIQDILRNPEIRICIFSYTRPIAKGFLRQIKSAFETNDLLKSLFPDVLWQSPKTEAPVWSMNEGLVVKRKGIPKESTVEAWGLIDDQPVSRHYDLLDFDDPITLRHAEMDGVYPEKVEAAFETALGLGSRPLRFRYKSVPFDAGDLTDRLIQKRFAPVRIHGAVNDDGEPVLHSTEEMSDLRTRYGKKRFALQYLCDYNVKQIAGEGFQRDWIRFYDPDHQSLRNLNVYVVVDASSGETSRNTDFTAMWVIGLGGDSNYYVLDIVRDKIKITQRVAKVFELHAKYRPMRVGYENYGLQGDKQAIEAKMVEENYHFDLKRLGGKMKKDRRIAQLLPIFEAKRMFLPESLRYVASDGSEHDLVRDFIDEEYLPWPFSRHKDMLDSLARICDPELNVAWPVYRPEGTTGSGGFRGATYRGSWMVA